MVTLYGQLHPCERPRKSVYTCDPCLVMCGILALSYHPHTEWVWSVVLNCFFFRIQTFCDSVQTYKPLDENRWVWYTLVFVCECVCGNEKSWWLSAEEGDCVQILHDTLSDGSMAIKMSMIKKMKNLVSHVPILRNWNQAAFCVSVLRICNQFEHLENLFEICGKFFFWPKFHRATVNVRCLKCTIYKKLQSFYSCWVLRGWIF